MVSTKAVLKTLVIILVIMILAVGAFFLFSWGRNLENSNDGDLADDLGGGSNYDLIDGPGGEPGEDAEAFEEYGEIPEDLGPVE